MHAYYLIVLEIPKDLLHLEFLMQENSHNDNAAACCDDVAKHAQNASFCFHSYLSESGGKYTLIWAW